MSFATDKWFKHIREEVLTEGLADIGLDEVIQKEIEAKMPEASEKGRMWVGAAWKSLDGNRVSNYGWFESHLIRTLGSKVKNFQHGDNNVLLDLINAYTTQPAGKWPKAKRKFAKNVLKFNFPDDVAKQLLIDFKVLEKRTWNWFISRIENVIVTLNQNPNNYQLIKDIPSSDYQQAENECFDFQKTQEDPDKIMHVFDDGSYWYDLDTYQCNMEGDRMGHCGRDEQGSLYSLRKKDPGKKASKSYITISYNTEDKTIYQIKGRQNTCPPRELWNHVAKFIEITGATNLEEIGEYSNQEAKFEELGQWLASNSRISFEGTLEKRMDEFRQEVLIREDQWKISKYSFQVDYDGASVGTLEDGDGYRPVWRASVSSIAAKLPFDLTEEAMLTFYAVGSPDPQDLALSDEIEEAIMEIFEEEDRNFIIKDAHHYHQAYAYLVKADNYEQAFLKADNMMRLMREDREQLAIGSHAYVVIWDIGRLFEDYVKKTNGIDKNEASGIWQFYTAVNELVTDLNDSLDAIEDLLVSKKLAKISDLNGYISKVEEEFNNFTALPRDSKRWKKLRLQASGVLFKVTKPQVQALKQIGLAPHPSMLVSDAGYYGGWTLNNYFWESIFEHTRQALAFAKQQKKLNFGAKFKEPDDPNLDDLFDTFERNSTIATAYKNFNKIDQNVQYAKINDPTIDYKITTSIDRDDLSILGPYLEYFDNNFDIIIKAFERGFREEIKRAEKEFSQKTGSDTNLPVEEGKLITEGLADIGLPDDLVGLIREFLPTASEKGRVWAGNAFKKYAILGPARDRMLAELITLVQDHHKLFQFGDNPEANPLFNLDRALRTGNTKQVIKARKSFVKAASKLGVEQTITNKILQLVDRGLKGALIYFLKERINSVVTTLNQNPNNYEMIKDFPDWDWSAANEAMEEYQGKIENPDQIIHRFDDGSYWYDLKTSRCKNEGERMGHCGIDMYGNLYSLRKKDEGKKESRSYVTISYNPEDKTIYQIKGRANEAPLEQFWKHIVEFVNLTGAAHNDELGKHSKSKESFEKLANYLSQETGITSDLVDYNLPEAKEELRVACNEKLQKFNEVYGENTPTHRLLVGGEVVRHQPRVFWQQETDMIAIELPFKPSKEQLIWSGSDQNNSDTQIILELIKTADSSELLSTKNPNLDISFVAAGDASRAIRVLGGGRSARIDSAKKADSRFWMIVDGLNPSFVDFINSAVVLNPEITRESAEGYANFLQRLGMLIETMKKAVAGPIKDQLAKWDAEDRGESLQEADNPLDVRLYEIDYVMSYPLGQGFEITDIHNIIRAIPDVTTVRTVGNAKRSQGNRTISLQRLKFALRGQKNRLEWVRQILLPQIRKISSKIRIHKVDRAELISSSRQSLGESYYNSTMRQSPGRTTPLPSIQNLIDDWVEGGVMYDQPTNHNLTRYSVMMPVEDLKHLCGREPRKHGHHFDAGYQNFIQNGTRDPIYLAIGKNGRAKITGNEDDLRYAIKAGVEEVPVFISYQRQV